MSYRIVYDSSVEAKTQKNRLIRSFLTLGFFICFLWTVHFFWPEGQELLKMMLIPGDPDSTLQAAEVFAQELNSGFSLLDAAENFCVAVMEHGNPG